MANMTLLERDIIDFAAKHGLLDTRIPYQLNRMKVCSREFTGSGFFTSFAIDPDCGNDTIKDHVITGIEGETSELDRGFGCAIFVKDGQIETIECFSYEESWPSDNFDYKLALEEEKTYR